VPLILSWDPFIPRWFCTTSPKSHPSPYLWQCKCLNSWKTWKICANTIKTDCSETQESQSLQVYLWTIYSMFINCKALKSQFCSNLCSTSRIVFKYTVQYTKLRKREIELPTDILCNNPTAMSHVAKKLVTFGLLNSTNCSFSQVSKIIWTDA
jgi:hypothetical protein